METNAFYPDFADVLILDQLKESMNYFMDYECLKVELSDNDIVNENDPIMFCIDQEVNHENGLRREWYEINDEQFPRKKTVFEGLQLSSDEGVAYFFVARFLFETDTYLYFWHLDQIKRVPLIMLEKKQDGRKPYTRITAVKFINRKDVERKNCG